MLSEEQRQRVRERRAQAERRRSELEAAAQPRAKIAKQATFDGSSCPDTLVDKPDPAELSSVPTTLDTSSDPAEATAIAPAALDASSDPAEATAIAPAALDSSSAPVALEAKALAPAALDSSTAPVAPEAKAIVPPVALDSSYIYIQDRGVPPVAPDAKAIRSPPSQRVAIAPSCASSSSAGWVKPPLTRRPQVCIDMTDIPENDVVPDGPSNLEELLKIESNYLEHLQLLTIQGDIDFFGCFSQVASSVCCITETYAGDGTGAWAACEIFRAAAALDICGTLVCYSAWEISSLGHKCLKAHEGPSRAIHHFGEVKNRCYDSDLQRLERIEKEYLDAYDVFNLRLKGSEHQLPDITMTKEKYSECVHQLEMQYLQALCEYLKDCHFKEHCWCTEHKRLCPVSPRSNHEYATCRCAILTLDNLHLVFPGPCPIQTVSPLPVLFLPPVPPTPHSPTF